MTIIWHRTVPAKSTFTIWDITPRPSTNGKKVQFSESFQIKEVERYIDAELDSEDEDESDDSPYEPSSTDDELCSEEPLSSCIDQFVEVEGKQDILDLLDNALEERELLDLPPPDLEDEERLMAAAGLPTAFGKRAHEYMDEAQYDSVFEAPAPKQKAKKQKRFTCQNESQVYDAKLVLSDIQAHTVFASADEAACDSEDEMEDEEDSSRTSSPITPSPKKEWTHDQVLYKYWPQRYSLWSRFDEGIWMDTVGWYSVTPEPIAIHIAKRLPAGHTLTVWDPFGGLGGNAIQFALHGHHVICSDINAERLAMAKHNARIYGVEEWIDFVHGDFFHLASKLQADVVFLSPPWGGPTYLKAPSFDVRTMMDLDGQLILDTALSCAPNIIYFLPKNSSLESVAALFSSKPDTVFEIEENSLCNRLKSVSVYYGPVFDLSV